MYNKAASLQISGDVCLFCSFSYTYYRRNDSHLIFHNVIFFHEIPIIPSVQKKSSFDAVFIFQNLISMLKLYILFGSYVVFMKF